MESERELVRIGEGEVRIVSISPERIEYRNADGVMQAILLEVCDLGEKMIGWRNLIANPPYVSFNDARKTSFLFASYEAAYELLLAPLRMAGWRTLDTT
jgi:hypothetical protein